jgi:2-iminobutanoate/2-iminopropanoate deaminase
MPREAHNSSHLPTPVGPFSHAVRVGELLFLSGQVGQDAASGQLVDGFAEQTRQIFSNVRKLLEDLGLDFDDVQRVNVFLSTMGNFTALNTIYAEHFSPPYPARTTVAVKELPMGAMVEMEMIARAR